MQNNLNRWYDPQTGRWLSEDPISFAADDPNLYRYVGNSVVDTTDPNGLAPPVGNRLQLGNSEAIYAGGSLSRVVVSPESRYYDPRERAYDSRVRDVFNESRRLNTLPIDYDLKIWEQEFEKYLGETVDFVFIGDYSGVEPTRGQVAAGVVAGFCGLDVTKDYLGLAHGFHHWEWSWGHAGNQALNGLALLPVVGAFKSAKYADDVGVVGKQLDCVPDVPKVAKPDLKKPSTLRNPDGTLKNAADQVDQIKKAQEQGHLIDSIEKSRQNLKNNMQGPYDPSDWE